MQSPRLRDGHEHQLLGPSVRSYCQEGFFPRTTDSTTAVYLSQEKTNGNKFLSVYCLLWLEGLMLHPALPYSPVAIFRDLQIRLCPR